MFSGSKLQPPHAHTLLRRLQLREVQREGPQGPGQAQEAALQHARALRGAVQERQEQVVLPET